MVLGSGWSGAADVIGETVVEVPLAELPGFSAPAVAGHGGTLRSVDCGGRRVLVLLGRTHAYEGRGADAVTHGVRTAVAAGARLIILTNAAGAINRDLTVGQPVLISDHLNMTFRSPLVGARFVDMSEVYSVRARGIARSLDPTLAEGVYAMMPGPQYETPAEIRMLRTLGADLVGMSTVLEAITARAADAEVLGISLVSNTAAGVLDQPLDHHEVLAAGRDAAPRIGALLAALVRTL